MARYLLARIAQIVPVLIGVSIVVFLLVRLIPGDPAQAMLGGRATPELLKHARQQLHLNEPIWTQYYHYVSGWVRGDFGDSFFYGSSVSSLTIPRVPVTLELLAYASVLALAITFPLASLAALYRGRFVDQLIRVVFTTTLGLPSFWLGLILALYLGVRVRLFPVGGAGTGGFDRLYHLTLPALTIALAMAPLLIRALRSSLIEVIGADFVVTARACGLRGRYRLWSYMIRNAILPLITVYSINIGWLIGGTVIVEQVFALPGIGTLLINSIATRDYAIIQLVTIMLALFVVVMNLVTDIAYVVFDPRVEFQSA